MRIGIIGLGDIARKAYLPVMGVNSEHELILCTRNTIALKKYSKQYKIKECVQTIEELINKNIDAAFIHAATEAHVDIAEKLLNNNIHVYVDKPISYSYDDSKRLVSLAEKKNRILMVGFNRRFAPMYKKLKEQSNPNHIIVQKNRTFIPDDIRRYIFDDFVHVVDTLRFLIPEDIENMNINGLKKSGKLYSVTLMLTGRNYTAIGIMNRDSGITEESVELISPGNKWVVRNMVEMTHYKGGEERKEKFGDWDSTLYKRGFSGVTQEFLDAVSNNRMPSPSPQDSLITHKICEEIVEALSKLRE